MATKSKSDAPQGKSQTQTQTQPQAGRKAWKPKTPVEVVLEQISRQEEKVKQLREALKVEEAALTRLDQARKVLQAS